MNGCDDFTRRLAGGRALRREALSEADRTHVGSCPACARALAHTRLVRGLLVALAGDVEPPAGFAVRVLAALPARPARVRADADPWRRAWGLVPMFAAAAAALLLLFQSGPTPAPVDLLPLESLSPGERLILEPPAPSPDLILAAVLEGEGR